MDITTKIIFISALDDTVLMAADLEEDHFFSVLEYSQGDPEGMVTSSSLIQYHR